MTQQGWISAQESKLEESEENNSWYVMWSHCLNSSNISLKAITSALSSWSNPFPLQPGWGLSRYPQSRPALTPPGVGVGGQRGSLGASNGSTFRSSQEGRDTWDRLRHREDRWTKPTWLHPAFLLLLGFLGATGAPGEGLVAEEVITQEASAQLGEEAEHVPDAVHHRQAPQVLLPIERCRHWKATETTT